MVKGTRVRMFYVHSDKCVGCGACVESCPAGAIHLGNRVAVIDRALCYDCGACAVVCGSGAIKAVEMSVLAAAGEAGAMPSHLSPKEVFHPSGKILAWKTVCEQDHFNGRSKKEVMEMPFGRGRFGWGGRGRGMGNPYGFCRFYPWLPRHWWAYGAGPYPAAPPGPYGLGRYAAGGPYYPSSRWYPWW